MRFSFAFGAGAAVVVAVNIAVAAGAGAGAAVVVILVVVTVFIAFTRRRIDKSTATCIVILSTLGIESFANLLFIAALALGRLLDLGRSGRHCCSRAGMMWQFYMYQAAGAVPITFVLYMIIELIHKFIASIGTEQFLCSMGIFSFNSGGAHPSKVLFFFPQGN